MLRAKVTLREKNTAKTRHCKQIQEKKNNAKTTLRAIRQCVLKVRVAKVSHRAILAPCKSDLLPCLVG